MSMDVAMEIVDRLLRLIEIMVWPGVALVIFFSFKDDLVKLLPSVKKLKAGPVEAEFENEIKKVTEEHWELPQIETSTSAASQRQELVEIAEINPKLAVIDAWQKVEFALKRAALQRFGGCSPPPDVSSPISLIRRLSEEGSLGSEDVTLLHELRGLRNQATHLEDFGLTFEAAKSYIDLSVRVQEKLNALAEVRT
jgi:hypothetical protein